MPGHSSPRISAPPLHATPRNHARPSDGAQIGVIAKALGTPLIPWQQQVADVAGERRPDGSYEYQVVVVSVPRQCGKTTLLRAVGTHSALVLGRDVFYTAQTGKDARERWSDLVKILQLHPAFSSRIDVKLRGGSEQVVFEDSGAAFRCFAPTPESLHGYTPPKVMIDEAFAQTGAKGDLLMGAVGPAQITVLDRQVWIVSTAGTAESTFLHDWIDRGVEGAPRVATFVWGASDEQDPFSLDDIAAFHPGVGQLLNGKVLTAQDVLEQADRNSRAEYERAYANRRTLTLSHLIPSETWRALAPEDGLQPPADPAKCVLVYDVAADQQAASIVAGWMGEDGRPHVKLVQAGPGMSWVARAVNELKRAWRVPDDQLLAVGNGPVLEVTRQLQQLGRQPRVLSEREYATACGAFLALIDDAGLAHDDGAHLTQSVVGLVTRAAVADGVAFSRRHSVGDSSAGIAAAVAAWAAGQRRTGKPVIRFGKAAS